MLKSWLAHPLTRGLNLDDPRTTALRRQIILEKHFLRQIYDRWYQVIARSLPDIEGAIVELGSGAGFLKDYIPEAITTEIFLCPGIDLVLDGHHLPVANDALRAIIMVDVLHHLPQPRRFLAEACRCLKPGASVIMIEPWVTPWSRLIYPNLHHEPFRPDSSEWEFPPSGPLSGANGAIPWLIFQRDLPIFAQEFPQFHVDIIRPIMPFSYLVSGGISLRSLMPSWAFPIWNGLDLVVERLTDNCAMFAHIVLQKQSL